MEGGNRRNQLSLFKKGININILENDDNEQKNNISKEQRHCTSLPSYFLETNELCDSELRPGMECMPLRTSGPYHYHVNDQTKSLQELQNEVGALLEFRDLVIETFPDLKQKMASISATNTIIGVPSTPLASRREWEPGIRVRKKLTAKEAAGDIGSGSLVRSRSNSHSGKKEPKSGEGNGSVIQDSGFSTETSSSKETHSASSSTGAIHGIINSGASTIRSPADTDNELWNLLDVIHRKSTRLREEVEHYQNFEKHQNRLSSSSQILNSNGSTSTNVTGNTTIQKAFQKELCRIKANDVHQLRTERDRLMDKLSEMEAETLTERIKTNKLSDELDYLYNVKKDLEEQLKIALNHQYELSLRVNELQRQGFRKVTSSSSDMNKMSPSRFPFQPPTAEIRKLSVSSQSIESLKQTPITTVIGNGFASNNHLIGPNRLSTSSSIFQPVQVKQQHRMHRDDSMDEPFDAGAINVIDGIVNGSDGQQLKEDVKLGRLDGLISSPNRVPKTRVADSKKVAAILLETNILELQRHLLTLTFQNQALIQRVEQINKSNLYMNKMMSQAKNQMDDLKFQLEEKTIELEGTKAQLRVLEGKGKLDFKPEHHSSALTLNGSINNYSPSHVTTSSMKAMIPLAMDEIQHHSSSTESTQDQTERDSNSRLLSSNGPDTPRRAKPSKIPLPGSGTKSYLAPKPPTGRNSSSGQRSHSGPPSNKSLSKSTSSLCAKSDGNSMKTRDLTISLNRPDSVSSLRKDSLQGNSSRSSSSIPVSTKTSPTTKVTSSSPVARHKRETFTSRARNMDSLTRFQTAAATSTDNVSGGMAVSSTSNLTKTNSRRDVSTTLSSPQRKQNTPIPPARRISSGSVGRGIDLMNSSNSNLRDGGDKDNGKFMLTHSDSNASVKLKLTSNHTENGCRPPIINNHSTISSAYRQRHNKQIGESIHNRDLINEYLQRSEIPPAIFGDTRSFLPMNCSSNEQIEIAYKHPNLLMLEPMTDDEFDFKQSTESVEADSIELVIADDNGDGDHKSRPIFHCSGDKLIAFSSLHVYDQQREVNERLHGCKLIGKVNPNLKKTWEQLNSAGEPLKRNQRERSPSDGAISNYSSGSKVNHQRRNTVHQHQMDSSENYYDSIDGLYQSLLNTDAHNLKDTFSIHSYDNESAGDCLAEPALFH